MRACRFPLRSEGRGCRVPWCTRAPERCNEATLRNRRRIGSPGSVGSENLDHPPIRRGTPANRLLGGEPGEGLEPVVSGSPSPDRPVLLSRDDVEPWGRATRRARWSAAATCRSPSGVASASPASKRCRLRTARQRVLARSWGVRCGWVRERRRAQCHRRVGAAQEKFAWLHDCQETPRPLALPRRHGNGPKYLHGQ